MLYLGTSLRLIEEEKSTGNLHPIIRILYWLVEEGPNHLPYVLYLFQQERPLPSGIVGAHFFLDI